MTNKLIKTAENNGILLENDYLEKVKDKRVDFDDAQSIMNYGSYILENIAEIFQNISALNSSNEVPNLEEYQKKIDAIGNFSEEIDQESKKDFKLHNKVKKRTFNFINSLFKTDLKADSVKFHNLLEQQIKNINEIGIFFDRMLNDIRNNVEMNQEALKLIKPFIDELEALIKVGEEDLQLRKELVDLYKQNGEDANVIMLEQTKISMFGHKLVALNKANVSYKQQETKINIGIFNKIALAQSCQEIINTTIPLMKSEAFSEVDIVMDKIRIEQQEKLANEIRESYLKSTEMVATNTAKITKLSNDGIIDTQTYEKANNVLRGALKTIRSITNEDSKLNEESEKIKQLNISLQEDMEQLTSYISSFREDTYNKTNKKAKILEKKHGKKLK